jgi:hypothetical protein
MTERSGERGISIGGNANVSGQIATGDNVVQMQQTGAADGSPAAAALLHLERLLDQYAAEVDELEKARRDLADIRSELEEADTDDERVSGALERLGRRVAGVAALTEAVQGLTATLGLP